LHLYLHGLLMLTRHHSTTEPSSDLCIALLRAQRAAFTATTQAELFDGVCRELVRCEELLAAAIDWHDAASDELVRVSGAGAQMFARPEPCGSNGSRTAQAELSRRALHEARLCIAEASSLDSSAGPGGGSERILRAAFPLQSARAPVGVLHIWTTSPTTLQGASVALIVEVSESLSVALEHLTRARRGLGSSPADHLAAIVASTDDAVVSQDLDGIVVSCNPAAQALFGYPAEEIVGSSITLLTLPGQADEERHIVERIRRGEHIDNVETTRVRKDGTPIAVSITYSPVWMIDDTGKRCLAGISKTVRDIAERRQAELRAERERLLSNSVIEALPGIFYLYDEAGRFLRWNRNFESVSGYSEREVSVMQPLDFFADDEKPLLNERIATVFANGESSVEAHLRTKDGELIPHFFTGRRLVLDGHPFLIGVGVDIADRKRAEESCRRSEARYRTTLDNTLEGCQLLDFEWRYLYLNDAAAEQNRRPKADLLGNSMPEMWPGIEATPVFAMLERCMTARIAVHDEVEFAFADGMKSWFDVRARPVPEGIFVLSVDISEAKEAERALRELNEDLEAKVRERTIALDHARKRAEEADQVKSAFLATMSHELRTPLNSILGFTGIVLNGMAGPLNAEQTKQLGMVQGSARHLLDLINDILDISKIEAGQLDVRLQRFDLVASIERVTSSVMPLVQAKGLTLGVVRPDEIELFESDRRRVEQILLNLLHNALKFTDRGGITLSVDFVASTSDDAGARGVCIRVADTGIGIAAADLATLFQPFRQLDTGIMRQHEGTGLGLAICRRLAELLGGSIHAESDRGHGSVFTLILPMKEHSLPVKEHMI
jgi:PAS domain S-box-containing protein